MLDNGYLGNAHLKRAGTNLEYTQEQAIERARRDGMTGGILVVPEVMTFEEWAEMMDREANDAGT